MRACRTQTLSVITRQCPPRQKSGLFHTVENSIKVGHSIVYKILSKWAIPYYTKFYHSGRFHTVQTSIKVGYSIQYKFYKSGPFHTVQKSIKVVHSIPYKILSETVQSSILYRRAKSGLILTASHYPRSNAGHALTVHPKLQALVYDTLPSTTAVFSYAIGSRKLSANEQFLACYKQLR